MRATGFPQRVRDVILERSHGRCEVMTQGCTFTAQAIHHRRPRGMGGSRRADTNTAANGLALCDACHRLIESERDAALTLGWLVPQNQSPKDVPVVYRGGRSALLGENCDVLYRSTRGTR